MSPASSSIFDVFLQIFGRLVGSAAGHFRDFFFFFSPVRLGVEERTVAWSTLGGWLGVRQVTFAIFFFHRFGSVSKSERSRGQHWG
jgi:hypothetical protein